MEVTIAEARGVEHDVREGLRRLLPQLSRSSPPPEEDLLHRLAECSAVVLLVARDEGGRVVGALSLVLVPLPTGLRGRLEDIVVDQAARGQGIGRALVVEALRRARAAGARDVDLTSRPERVAAARVYEATGFVLRETNVYRHELRAR